MTVEEYEAQQAEMHKRVQAAVAAERKQHEAEIAAKPRMVDAAAGCRG